MRLYLTLPLIAVAACNIESDATNEQVTVEYNKQQMKDAAVKARRTAEDVHPAWAMSPRAPGGRSSMRSVTWTLT